MNSSKELVERVYKCKICGTTHVITLKKDIFKEFTTFPFPYVFLHGELKDILTILYLDRDLEVRSAEVQRLFFSDDNVFSKDQTSNIVEQLMEEIERLRKENEFLFQENQKLKMQENQ